MKSVRLNQTMRNTIIDNMITAFSNNWFQDKPYKNFDELYVYRDNCRKNIMTTLWLKVYGQYEDALKNVPEFFLKKNALFSIASTDKRYYATTLENRPGKGNSVDLLLEADEYDEYFSEVIEIDSVEEIYKKELAEFKKEIRSIIESVSTTKQLIDLWPTAEPFIHMTLID
ncbi:MAG: Nmad5 family putative nucleotide modification protein, partial [Flavobacterium sp.]|uniref:Nmad5 family putative nucleotide modification protein n=1 Tax=Flavobacterium sp. TaxID=239 RepID=UPI0026100412